MDQKSHNTFTRIYLRELAGQDHTEDSYHLGAFIAAQQVMPPSEPAPRTKEGRGGMKPYRWGISELSDTIEWTFHPASVN